LPVFCSNWLLPVDAGPHGREFMIEQRLIDPLKPIARCFAWYWVTEMRES
jgi:hypothetical protein